MVRRTIGEKEPSKGIVLFGLIEAVISPPLGDSQSRMSLLIDAVRANSIISKGELPRRQSLSLIRIMTTRGRFADFINPADLVEGNWVRLTLNWSGKRPICWSFSAESDYFEAERLSLEELSLIIDGGTLSTLKTACAVDAEFFNIQEMPSDPFGEAESNDIEVIALDVGHASCNALYVNDKCIGYFDVGAPIAHNLKSFPTTWSHVPGQKGFVLLSHWDFDHFSLVYRYPQLKNFIWYAPNQDTGPNVSRLRKSMEANIRYLDTDYISPRFQLRKCTGNNPRDRNATGYAVRMSINRVALLLPGDANYNFLPAGMATRLNRLLIPHHGGAGDPPPTPRDKPALPSCLMENRTSIVIPIDQH